MTGRPSTLTRETITALASARRVGATLREAAAAHGIAYPSLMRWMRQGRAGEGDPLCAELATELDRAAAHLRQVLWSRALKGTEKDGRLALEAIKHLDDAPIRRARLRLAKAQAAVEARRATGEHVDRQRVEGAGIRVYLPEES